MDKEAIELFGSYLSGLGRTEIRDVNNSMYNAYKESISKNLYLIKSILNPF